MVSRVLGQTEIDKSHFSVLAVHNVFRLDVSVRYAQSVAVSQGFQAFVDYFSGFLFSVGLSLLDVFVVAIEELASSAQLHHEIEVMLVIIGLKVLDDVGMVDLLQKIDLVHHVSKVLLRHLVLVEHFDSDLEFAICLVCALVDFTEGTFSKDMPIDVVNLLKLCDTSGHSNL